tara:strand:+ start:17461 stop:18351 length:891 start_codon:yes stop_codon:yes gene_type:complete
MFRKKQIMNNLDEQYKVLLKTILEHGINKEDRTGTGTRSIFGYTLRHNMQDGFPLLTTKKMAWKQIVTELLWFLRGDTNIEFLHRHGCHIWDGDYEKSGRTDGNLGPIYGKQWRSWTAHSSNREEDEEGYFYGIDQVENLIQQLKTNPDSRRLLVNAWNVADLKKMTLPPCHIGFQCYVRDKKYLSLMWNQRSVDTFLGLPFNIASYGLLLTILAKEVGMIPDQLIGNLGDTHIYSNHMNQVKEQLERPSHNLPNISIEYSIPIPEYLSRLDYIQIEDIKLSNYTSEKTIKAPLSN